MVDANLRTLSSYSAFRPQEVHDDVVHELADAARRIDSDTTRAVLRRR